MDQRPDQIPHQRKCKDNKKAYKKIFNIIYHQGTANENKIRYCYTAVRTAKISNTDKEADQQELSFTVGRKAE